MSEKPTYNALVQRVQELESAERELRQDEARLRRMNIISERLFNSDPLSVKMKRITDGVVDILGADFARIWITNLGDQCDDGCVHATVNDGPHVCRDRDRCLHLIASSGRYTHLDGAHGRVPFDCYKIGRVAAAEDPGFLTNDVTKDPRVHNHDWARELGLVSFAGYRLQSSEDEPIGVLAVFSKQPLSVNEEMLLQTIASTASAVIVVSRFMEMLQESDDRYRLLIENSLTGIYIHVGGILKFVNKRFAEMLGYRVEEILGRLYWDFVHPEDRAMVKRISLARTRGEAVPAEYEFRHQTKSGEPVWVKNMATLIQYGGETANMGNLTYIDDRKHMAAALIESEKKWRHIVHNSPQLGISLDPDGKIVYSNAHFQKLTGWKAEEIIGRDWFDTVIPENIRDEIRQVFKNVMSTNDTVGFSTYENDILTKSGQLRHISWANVLTRDPQGEIQDVTCLGIDLTERQHANEALRKSETKYRNMMESMTDPVYICSSKMTVEYMNQAMIRRVGRDAVGENCHKAIHDLDHPCEWCNHQKVFNGKPFSTNVLSPRDNRTYRVNNIPIQNDDGSMSKMTIFRDITEYLVAVEERERVKAQLLQTQKIEAIGTLAGGIAHDFNNILSSIIGFTELALDDVTKGTPLEDNLQEVYTAGKRARDLVKQILAFARQSDVKQKPVNVGAIAGEALRLIRSTIPTTIEIKERIKSSSLIMSNPSQIHQVFMNLFTNAAHAMEDDGGTLTVEVTDVDERESLSTMGLGFNDGRFIKIAVSDTGTGISPDVIESIFAPYFTTKEVGSGTGMGLAVVHGIVESSGGTITVDSELGRGAVFTIYLPIAKIRTPHQPYEAEILPTGREHILFVDDELPIARIGSQILEGLGYTVTSRTSSVEALELFRSRPSDFDAVITDMTMPNMTGEMLAIEMMKIRPDIPVMLCTGYSKKISEKAAGAIGIKAFAYKPIVKTDLAKTVRNVLDQAKA